MKKFLPSLAGLAIAALLLPSLATAETHTFQVDPVHSQVGFKVRHLVAKTAGRFNDFSASVSVDPANVAGTLSLKATVQVASINTENEDRDKHLRSADFFNAEEFPTLTFVSKSVKDKGDNMYAVTGDITIRGVTKPVTLDVEFLGTETNPFTKTPTTGLDITGSVNRQDFGMKWNKTLDSGGLILGDTVQLDIHVEATVPPAAKS